MAAGAGTWAPHQRRCAETARKGELGCGHCNTSPPNQLATGKRRKATGTSAGHKRRPNKLQAFELAHLYLGRCGARSSRCRGILDLSTTRHGCSNNAARWGEPFAMTRQTSRSRRDRGQTGGCTRAPGVRRAGEHGFTAAIPTPDIRKCAATQHAPEGCGVSAPTTAESSSNEPSASSPTNQGGPSRTKLGATQRSALSWHGWQNQPTLRAATPAKRSNDRPPGHNVIPPSRPPMANKPPRC